jgi:hypothetical protein
MPEKNRQLETNQQHAKKLKNEPYTVMGTVGPDWSPRTVLRETENSKPGAREDWVLTREAILKVVRRFPDVMQAVRDALNAIPRPCPEELCVPG